MSSSITRIARYIPRFVRFVPKPFLRRVPKHVFTQNRRALTSRRFKPSTNQLSLNLRTFFPHAIRLQAVPVALAISRKTDQPEGFDALLNALEQENWDLLQSVDREILSSITDEKGRSLLLVAAEKGLLEAVRWLLENEIALESRDRKGNTPLHLAAAMGFGKTVELLAKYYSDWTNNDQENALHMAVRHGHSHLISILIEVTDPRATCSYKGHKLSPLALAVAEGWNDCFYMLVDNGHLTLDDHTRGIGNLLHVALLFNRSEILEDLFQNYPDQMVALVTQQSGEKNKDPLSLAAKLGYEFELSYLAARGSRKDSKDLEGKTAAHLAAIAGNIEGLELLVFLGFDMQLQDADGKTPRDHLTTATARSRLNVAIRQQKEGDSRHIVPENLVFHAGGPQITAYVGALQVLERRGIFSNIKKVCGTSFSSIIATMVALGYSTHEIESELLNFSLREHLDPSDPAKLQALFSDETKLEQVLSSIFQEDLETVLARPYPYPIVERLRKIEGVCKGDRLHEWLENMIFTRTGIHNCTFGELRKERIRGNNFKDLYLFATDLHAGHAICFSTRGDMDTVIIADAIRASLSVPGLLEPFTVRHKDTQEGIPYTKDTEPLCIDGAYTNNFPLDLFKSRTLGVYPTVAAPLDTRGKIESWEDLLIALSGVYASVTSKTRRKSGIANKVVELDIEYAHLLDFDNQVHTQQRLIKRGHDAANATNLSSVGQRSSSRTNLLYTSRTIVERKDLSDQIDRAVTSQPTHERVNVVLLHGLSGMGKTTAVKSFARYNSGLFSHIFVVDYRTQETRWQSYRDIAQKLRIFSGKMPYEDLKKLVHRYLQQLRTNTPWLMILDNVDDVTLNPRFDFPWRGGHILVTSTKKDILYSPDALLKVGPLTEEEAISLLKSVTQEKESESMRLLAKTLGCFPLALNLAAHYIKSQDGAFPISEYLQEYPEPMKMPMPADPDYRKTLENVWTITLKKIEEKSRAASFWIFLCVHFNPDFIPKLFLKEFVKTIKDVDMSISVDGVARTLENYAVFTFNKKTQTFSIHPLMQKVIGEKLETNLCQNVHSSANEIVLATSNQFVGLRDSFIWLSNALILSKSPLATNLKKKRRYLLAKKIAFAFSALKKHEAALLYSRRTVQLCGDDFPLITKVRSLLQLSCALLSVHYDFDYMTDNNRDLESLDVIWKAYSLLESLNLEQRNSIEFRILFQLGQVYLSIDPHRAIHFSQMALEDIRDTPTENMKNFVIAYQSITSAYRHLGDYSQAYHYLKLSYNVVITDEFRQMNGILNQKQVLAELMLEGGKILHNAQFYELALKHKWEACCLVQLPDGSLATEEIRFHALMSLADTFDSMGKHEDAYDLRVATVNKYGSLERYIPNSISLKIIKTFLSKLIKLCHDSHWEMALKHAEFYLDWVEKNHPEAQEVRDDIKAKVKEIKKAQSKIAQSQWYSIM